MSGSLNSPRIGWIGAGRMGAALAGRLVDAGHDVAVYNRTRSKAEMVAGERALVVDRPVDLADRDIVFSMVSASADLEQVVLGPWLRASPPRCKSTRVWPAFRFWLLPLRLCRGGLT
jgi:3-hydroxyisobutyrate dehydrogenase-like beta-hydroxyacid dehydrogenase